MSRIKNIKGGIFKVGYHYLKMNCLKDTLESWREANKMIHWNAEDLKQWIRGLVASNDLREKLLVYLEDEIDLDHGDFYARVKGKSL